MGWIEDRAILAVAVGESSAVCVSEREGYT